MIYMKPRIPVLVAQTPAEVIALTKFAGITCEITNGGAYIGCDDGCDNDLLAFGKDALVVANSRGDWFILSIADLEMEYEQV